MKYINSIKIRLITFFYKNSFKSFGKKSYILNPLKIDGASNILIGDNVNIAYKCWLAALPLTDAVKPRLLIGNGTSIGNFNHIFATNEIIIGNNVLTADKVYISDNLHSYENIDIPILKQPIKQIGSVLIGDGTWIGENACIIGAKIGENCVVGANAVVTKDIPDYCVVVGLPAVIIKRYCVQEKKWKKTDKKGNFI